MVDRHVGPGQTYATIALGIAAAQAGDIVYVHDKGTPYLEGSLSRNAAITLRPALDVVGRIQIDGTGHNNVMSISFWTLCTGFDMYGSTQDAVIINGSTIEDCLFHDTGQDGITAIGASFIRRCFAYNNPGRGLVRSSGAPSFEACVVYNNGLEGALTAGSRIDKCTFYKNNTIGSANHVSCGDIYDSIIVGTCTNGVNCIGVIDNCCSFGHIVANFFQAPDAESIQVDPLFTNEVGADFSLTAASPCVSLGGGSSIVTNDVLNVAYDAPGSIGAYQYVEPVSSWAYPQTICDKPVFGPSFTIYASTCLSNQYDKNIERVPISLNTPGIPSLRSKNTPYKVFRG